MKFLRQSTSVDEPIGPFLDESDGKTAETGLTITQPDIRLKKNGGAWAQKNAAQTLSHEENGWYEVTLDATDTNTVGHLVVAIHESGALPVWQEYTVVEEAVYDLWYAASSTGHVTLADGAHGGTAATLTLSTIDITENVTVSGGISLGSDFSCANFSCSDFSVTDDFIVGGDLTVTGNLTANAFVGNITGNLSGSVGSVTGNVGGNVTGSVGSVAAGGITAASIANNAIDAATFAADVDAEFLSYIVDDATRIDASALNTATATTIPAIAADLPTRPTRGVALDDFQFTMVSSSDGVSHLTGKTVTATRSLDGAAFASCTNSVVEISNGWYKIDLSAADMTGTTIALRFTASGCIDRNVTIVTGPT